MSVRYLKFETILLYYYSWGMTKISNISISYNYNARYFTLFAHFDLS